MNQHGATVCANRSDTGAILSCRTVDTGGGSRSQVRWPSMSSTRCMKSAHPADGGPGAVLRGEMFGSWCLTNALDATCVETLSPIRRVHAACPDPCVQALYDIPMYLPLGARVDLTVYLPVGDVMDKYVECCLLFTRSQPPSSRAIPTVLHRSLTPPHLCLRFPPYSMHAQVWCTHSHTTCNFGRFPLTWLGFPSSLHGHCHDCGSSLVVGCPWLLWAM
jgi:hypothetical protein